MDNFLIFNLSLGTICLLLAVRFYLLKNELVFELDLKGHEYSDGESFIDILKNEDDDRCLASRKDALIMYNYSIISGVIAILFNIIHDVYIFIGS